MTKGREVPLEKYDLVVGRQYSVQVVSPQLYIFPTEALLSYLDIRT